MSRLTRYVPIAPAPPRRPSNLPANSSLDTSSPSAISRFENNTPSETRHHVEPDLSVLYQSASTDYQVPLFDQHDPRNHHALANQQRLRTPNYGTINIPTTLPPAPRTTSRHTPRSPDKHTFAVPRVPQRQVPATDAFNGLAPDLLQNYINMLSTPNTQADAVAPATPVMNKEYDDQILRLIQSVAAPGNPGNPTPHSTPFLGDYETMRSIDELLTSPEFTSPLFEDTPNLSDASPFTPSSSSTRHQTSPALFDYSDTSSGGVPLFGPSPIVVNSSNNAQYGTPNLDALQLQSGGLGFENLDSLLSMPNGSPTSPAVDTQALFSPNSSPLFTSEHNPERPGVGQRSVSDPTAKRAQPTGHRKNLAPEQLLAVDAPTQQRNYYGPSATSRKNVPAGFEERRAKIVAKRRRGLGAEGEEVSEDILLQAAVEDKRRANTVAARRSRQRKLEHVKKLEDELEETKRAMELWKERAIAAEGMVRRLEGRE